MFGLIRRISHSVIPRPDRPWEDDPTSNAPHKGKKRRMSASEEPEPDMEQANKKKVRGGSSTSSVVDTGETAHDRLSTPLPQVETQEVKEVTQGVKDVELTPAPAPECVPLPNEESDDLEESSSIASTPPLETQPESDVAGDEGASRPGESDATDNTAFSEKLEKGKEGRETSVVVEGEVPVPDVTADVTITDLARKVRSKTKEDAST